MLGSAAIREEIKNGNILITPFEENSLGPNSYDLRLGPWICRQQKRWLTNDFVEPVRLKDPVDPMDIWRSPEQVQNGILRLAPGELILAHTEEIVGCFGDIVGAMHSRSTSMRCGIAVCMDAGLGDIGFMSKWTMEISNHTYSTIEVPVGMRICQMTFHRVEGADKDYQSKGGTYGMKKEVAWTPSDMLPRSRLR